MQGCVRGAAQGKFAGARVWRAQAREGHSRIWSKGVRAAAAEEDWRNCSASSEGARGRKNIPGPAEEEWRSVVL
ncbi:Vacuolar Fusion Protein Mon1-like B [Manis pentadactyla]|nr:Vacuolar Fusion Protein Mon1-like B [Manis pentadactyla]